MDPKQKQSKNEYERNTCRRSRNCISFHDENEKASHNAQLYLCKIYFGKGKPIGREIKSAVAKVWGEEEEIDCKGALGNFMER